MDETTGKDRCLLRRHRSVNRCALAGLLLCVAACSPSAAPHPGGSQLAAGTPQDNKSIPVRDRGNRRDKTRKPARGTPIDLSRLKGKLAFDCGEDVCVARPDGSHLYRLTNRPGPEADPTWALNGIRLAYRDSRRGFNRNDEIYVADPNGRHRRNITSNDGNDWGPDWSPNGRLIAFNSSEHLVTARPDGSQLREVTDVEAEYPSWAPGSRRLTFMSSQLGAGGVDPNYDIYVVDLDGAHLTKLTHWPHEDGWPAWSPDARWIAFTTSEDAGHRAPPGLNFSIWLMHPDGTHRRRLVGGMIAALPTWAPDGKTIMFSGSRYGPFKPTLWLVRPDGTGLRRLSFPVGNRDLEFSDWTTGRSSSARP
jgi:Tol biopolymer transport system component